MKLTALASSLVVLASGCADFGALSQDYSPFCSDGALFCDGFERGLGAWAFDPSPDPAAVVSLAKSPTHNGALALDAAVTAGAPAHNAITHTLGTSEPTLAVRVFVKPTAFTPSTQLLSLDNGITVTLSNGHWGLQDGPQTTASTVVPVSDWTCLELVVSSDSAVLSVDGTKSSLSGSFASVGAISLGALQLDGTTAAQLDFDDVNVATAAAGCPAATP